MLPLEISARIVVNAEPERVWNVALDWSRQREWMWGTQVSGGTGAGAVVAARTGIGRIGFTDTMVITEWDPPRRCVVRHTGAVVRGHGIFEVTRHGQGSEFGWTELLELPLSPAGPLGRAAGALGRGVVAPLARRGLASSLRRLARLL